MCDTLIIKYKHYKRKYEREHAANESLAQQLAEMQQSYQKLRQPQSPIHKSPVGLARYSGSVLAPEFDRLGCDIETILARNVELESAVAEITQRNTDLKNCLLIAQSRKHNLQSALLSNMRVYEKSLEQSCIMENLNSNRPNEAGTHPNSVNDLVLMEQLFSVQDNIEKILLAEVAYLRELVTAQQYTIISPRKSKSNSNSPMHPGTDGLNLNSLDLDNGKQLRECASELREFLQPQPTQALQPNRFSDNGGDNHDQEAADNTWLNMGTEVPEHDRSILDSLPIKQRYCDDAVVTAYSHVYNNDNSGLKRRATTRARTLASRRVNSPTGRIVPAELRQRWLLATQHPPGFQRSRSASAAGRFYSGNHSSHHGKMQKSAGPQLSSGYGYGRLVTASRTGNVRIKKAKASRKWATEALQAEVDKILRDISGVAV
jgi:hypothetical protein